MMLQTTAILLSDSELAGLIFYAILIVAIVLGLKSALTYFRMKTGGKW